ncbi:retrovirus-related pol polyprotein from transposon TNT 1-94 [Tanacetum coccineum]
MDSMIPNGQKNTLAVYMILFGADNRPQMLDKPLYDSWKIKMELYTQNREHGRMILESVEHSPLDWPSIEVDGVTRLKKYAELSASEKLQDNFHQEACPQPQSVPQIEYIVSIVNQQTHLAEFPQIDSSLAVPVFKQGDDPIDAINKMMSSLSTIVTSRRQSSFAAGTSRTRANISGTGRNNSGQQKIVKCFNCQGEGHMARQCPKPKRKKDATWFWG